MTTEDQQDGNTMGGRRKEDHQHHRDHEPDLHRHRRSEDDRTRFPEWAKFAGVVIGTTATIFFWAESRFVSRLEWNQHSEQQRADLIRIADAQKSYAESEKGTATTLNDISQRLSSIENDVGWLRQYMDVHGPKNRLNNNKTGKP